MLPIAFLLRPSIARLDTLKRVYYIVLYSWVIRTKTDDEIFGPGPLGLLRKWTDIGQDGEGEMADCLFDGAFLGKNQRTYYSHVRTALPVLRLKRSEPAGMEEVHQGCLHGVIEVVSQGQDRASPLPGLGVQDPPPYVGAQAAGGTFLPHLDYAENGVLPHRKGDAQPGAKRLKRCSIRFSACDIHTAGLEGKRNGTSSPETRHRKCQQQAVFSARKTDKDPVIG